MATKRAMKKQEKKIAAQTDIKEAIEAAAEKIEDKVEDVVETVTEDIIPEVKEDIKDAVKKVRKTAAKKDIKTKIMIQHQGKEVDSKDLIAAVKKEWTKSKRKIGEIKSMDLYVKPEDGAVYYVINGDVTGKVEF